MEDLHCTLGTKPFMETLSSLGAKGTFNITRSKSSCFQWYLKTIWALNVSLDVEFLAPRVRIHILVLYVVLNILDFIILNSMGIRREGSKLDFSERCISLMVCEVYDPNGVAVYN